MSVAESEVARQLSCGNTGTGEERRRAESGDPTEVSIDFPATQLPSPFHTVPAGPIRVDTHLHQRLRRHVRLAQLEELQQPIDDAVGVGRVQRDAPHRLHGPPRDALLHVCQLISKQLGLGINKTSKNFTFSFNKPL